MWWSTQGSIEAANIQSPGQETGPAVSYDITSMVQAWVNGQPNLGIVLMGEEENLGAFTEKGCVAIYSPETVVLEVQYQ